MNSIKSLHLLTRFPKIISDLSSQNHSLLNNGVLADKIILANEILVSQRNLHWRSYGNALHQCPNLSREFLVQLWVADAKLKKNREKRKQVSYFSGSSMTQDGRYDFKKLATKPLESTSPQEVS